MQIMENMLLQNNDGKISRIISYNRFSSIIYVIDIDKGNRWAYPMEKDDVVNAVENGDINLLTEDPYFRHVIEEELSSAEKSRRDQAWEVVSHVLQQLEHEQQIYLTKYRQKAIEKTIAVFR